MRLSRKAYYLLIGFFYILSSVSAQDQRVADSLVSIYKRDTAVGQSKLELLRNLSFNEVNDLVLSLKYAEELIQLAIQANDNNYLFHGYYQKGNTKRLAGELEAALDAFIKSAEVAQKSKHPSREGSAYGAIADIYAVSRNHKNAMLYYHKAIATLQPTKDSIALASYISNAGDALLKNQDYDSALYYFKRAIRIFEKVNYPTGKAYCLGNIGMVYASTGQNTLAEKNINAAIKLLEETQDYYPICVYLISMCDIYNEKKDSSSALNYAFRSLKLAQQYNLKEQISDANLKLSQLYEQSGNQAASYKYYKAHITYRDSVNNIKSVQQLADLRTDFEVSQKQVEVDLLNQEKRNQRIVMISLFSILALTTALLGTLYWYFRNISREKKRSESLLLNILPSATAKELKERGKVEAVRFEQVTVLFTDFVKFTSIAEKVAPEQLVESIDYYFKGFDEITSKYGLEKIKTVGDSYMCACGLPTPDPAHARNVVQAAKEMVAMVKHEYNTKDELSHFEVRVGVHTGPVVAGIVGLKKWQYDIWGDTVNIASRMESKSEPGRVNLSESTYREVKDHFNCEYRGELEVKNRGLMKMYFLNEE